MKISPDDSNQFSNHLNTNLNSLHIDERSLSITQNFMENQIKSKTKFSSITNKKYQFRQKIRKQYLDSYFIQKRNQFIRQNQKILNKSNFHNFNSNLQQNTNKIWLQSICTQNNFENIIFIQRLIEQKEKLFQNGQIQFVHTSFYDFLTNIISQCLDYKYFETFQDQKTHQIYFNYLKNQIYQKLAQQIQGFLYDIVEFNKLTNKRNAWAYLKFSQQTYINLIFQLGNWVSVKNLKQSCQQKQDNLLHDKIKSIFIPIQQQLNFLLMLLIQITYEDQVIPYSEFQKQDLMQLQQQNIEKFCQKYLTKFSYEIQQQKQAFSITYFIIRQTQILQSLKYFIVFGFPDFQQQKCGQTKNKKKQKRKKEKEKTIDLIINLFKNIQINVGSQFLYQYGLFSQLNIFVNQPIFQINIRNKFTSRQNKIKIRPTFQYTIYDILLDSFLLFRRQESLQQLTKRNSLQIVMNILEEILKLKLDIKNRQKQNFQISRLNQWNQILFLQEDQDQDIQYQTDMIYGEKQSQNNGFQCNQLQYYHKEQCYEQKLRKKVILQQIIKDLIYKCLKVIWYHFQVGEYEIKMNDRKDLIRRKMCNKSLTYDDSNTYYWEDKEFKEFQIKMKRYLYKLQNEEIIFDDFKYSSGNPFILKFKYMLNYYSTCQQILYEQQKGIQLLKSLQ